MKQLLRQRNLVVKLNKEAKKSLRIYRPHACNFIKKETRSQVSSCEFCKISKNTFFTEHVWMTASIT